MKKLIGMIVVLGLSTAIAGCHHPKKKGHGKHHKGHSGKLLPGDSGKRTPNCAADGPGCRQMIR